MGSTLNGEGELRVVISTRVRRECDNCGEPAIKRLSYCYVNGRRNPASSMYRRDDCTYCSDHDAYSCTACEKEVERACCPEGMEWGATYTLCEGNEHMFLTWKDRKATAAEIAAIESSL